MAKKLQAKKIKEALQKAQRVGEAEERFLLDGCEVVLRSLRSEEFQIITEECSELEDLAYLNAYKKGHIARAFVETNGESFREFDFVEVDIEEVDVATREPVSKTISLETHKFVMDYILSTWSREAIDVAYRKFLDVTEKAEKKAAQGVEFTVPDETAEDKFRRLLIEAKELEGQIPFELVARILDEVGYMSKASKQEQDAIDQKLAQVGTETAPQEAVAAQQSPQVQASMPVEPPPQTAPRLARRPLNQIAVDLPVPTSQPTVVARQQDPPPNLAARPEIPISPDILRRAREIEALEGNLDSGPAVTSATRLTEGVAELNGTLQRVNPQAVEPILNQPPVAGVNPRFRSPPRP